MKTNVSVRLKLSLEVRLKSVSNIIIVRVSHSARVSRTTSSVSVRMSEYFRSPCHSLVNAERLSQSLRARLRGFQSPRIR